MSLLEPPIIPDDTPKPEVSAARRRRAARRAMFPTDAEGQAALIALLSRRAYPSLELFVFSLVCGAIVGFGFFLDSQAILLLGLLVTPMMTPWVGFLLAIYTGKLRFLFETLMALLISGFIVFLGGLLTGFAARLYLPRTFDNVFIHARLWIPELLVLSIGAIILVMSFARSEDKPFLPSLLIAYAFYLPINASGFGLGSGVQGIFPEGLLVFLVHFSLATALGLITLFILKLKPTFGGGIASGITIAAFLGISIFFMYPQITAAQTDSPPIVATSTYTPAPESSSTPTATIMPTNTTRPSITPSLTRAATLSPTPTAGTPLPSETPSITPTSAPVFGTVRTEEGGGANLRQAPNGKFIRMIPNGATVEVRPETRIFNGVQWANISVNIGGVRLEGWMISSVIRYGESTATPTP